MNRLLYGRGFDFVVAAEVSKGQRVRRDVVRATLWVCAVMQNLLALSYTPRMLWPIDRSCSRARGRAYTEASLPLSIFPPPSSLTPHPSPLIPHPSSLFPRRKPSGRRRQHCTRQVTRARHSDLKVKHEMLLVPGRFNITLTSNLHACWWPEELRPPSTGYPANYG